MYSFVRVATFTLSPGFIKRGTCIFKFVLNVASFVTLVAVSPLRPGSVFDIFNSTNVGAVILIALPIALICTLFMYLSNLKFYGTSVKRDD